MITELRNSTNMSCSPNIEAYSLLSQLSIMRNHKTNIKFHVSILFRSLAS